MQKNQRTVYFIESMLSVFLQCHIPKHALIHLTNISIRGGMMKPEIKKIVTRSALFFAILAVSVCGMQLAVYRNNRNAPDTVPASAAQSTVIVLDAGHGESTEAES